MISIKTNCLHGRYKHKVKLHEVFILKITEAYLDLHVIYKFSIQRVFGPHIIYIGLVYKLST